MRRLWASVMVVALASPAAAGAESGVDDLKVVAHVDLGAAGPYRAVAVAGSTALVGAGDCSRGSVTVVGLGHPDRPQVLTTLPLPAGAAPADLDAVAARTGSLGAIALGPCPAAGAVLLYDVTRPPEATLVARVEGAARSVSLASPPDGQVIALLGADALRVVDVSDPANPSAVARWTPPEGGSCRDVRSFSGGQRAVAVCGERVYDIDLSTPSTPSTAGSVPGAGQAASVAGVLLSDRTLALVSDADGLRALDLEADQGPREAALVQSPGGLAPGRAIASGELAFVAWHADGLRVIDLNSPGMPAVARFVPPGAEPDVVAVALLPNHVVVVDATSGLWLLERPSEGSKDSNSDDIKVLLAALTLGGLLVFLVVPRVAAMLSAAGAAVGSARRAGARRAA